MIALLQRTPSKRLRVGSSVGATENGSSKYHQKEALVPFVIIPLQIVEKVLLSVGRARVVCKVLVHIELLVRCLKVEIVRDRHLVIGREVFEILAL